MDAGATPRAVWHVFYRLDEELFERFPRLRPPLDYFRYDASRDRVRLFLRRGERLTAEQGRELAELCRGGLIYVSRKDRAVYLGHVAHQLDLVLLDEGLTPDESAGALYAGVRARLATFFEQPLRENLLRLVQDALILSEYAGRDFQRLAALLARFDREHSLASHSLNAALVGLFLYQEHVGAQFDPRRQERLFLGLLLRDVGMSKIPLFVVNKERALNPGERESMRQHPLLGERILRSMDVTGAEVLAPVLEHHERLDGSGYPGRKSGEGIGLPGRIAAVADSFSAMISTRRHARGMRPEEGALELLRDPRYDSSLVRCLARVVPALA